MRRISQLNRSIDSLRQTPLYTSPSSYIRIACRHRAAFTTSLPRASLADKVQSKLKNSIWRKEDEESNKPDGKEVVQNDSEAKAKAFTETEDILGSYMPAKTWEGLEIVGGKALDWEEKWNYQGFMPDMQLRPTDNDHITTAVHRAVVEVYTLYQAGKPLSICNEPLSVVDLYRDTTSDVQFVETEAGVQLKYTEEQTQSKILKSLESNSEQTEFAPKVSWGSDALESETEFSSTDETATKVAPTESEESVAADRSEVDPSEYDLDGLNEQQADFEGEDEFTLEKHHQSLIAKWDPLWLQVSLEDPQVKFAVLKRILQLGIRLSDQQINSITTVQSLLSRLLAPPKARKLSEALSTKGEIENLANVKFSDRRITPIDKEVAVGRWKVITKELEKRGLPVTGKEDILTREERPRV